MTATDRHEQAALLSILSGPDADKFILESLSETPFALAFLRVALHGLVEDKSLERLGAVGACVSAAVLSYIRQCPAFDEAVAKAELDERSAREDAMCDEGRDNEVMP